MDFLTKLFIPCALLAGLLIPYTLWWVKKYDKKNDIMNISDDAYLKNKFTDPPPPHHPNHIPPPPPLYFMIGILMQVNLKRYIAQLFYLFLL